jgi:hypothetical protein
MLKKHQAKRIAVAALWLCIFVPLAALGAVVIWINTGGLDREFSQELSALLDLPVTVEGVELEKPGVYNIRRIVIGTSADGPALAEAEDISIAPNAEGTWLLAVIQRLKVDLTDRDERELATLERRLMRPYGKWGLGLISVNDASVKIGCAGMRTSLDGINFEIRMGPSGLQSAKGGGGGIIFDARLSSDGVRLVEELNIGGDIELADIEFPKPLPQAPAGKVSGQFKYEQDGGGQHELQLSATDLQAFDWSAVLSAGTISGTFDITVKQLRWAGNRIDEIEVDVTSTRGGIIAGPLLGWLQRQKILGIEGIGDYLMGAFIGYKRIAFSVVGTDGMAHIQGEAGNPVIAVTEIFGFPVPLLSATGRRFPITTAWKQLAKSLPPQAGLSEK